MQNHQIADLSVLINNYAFAAVSRVKAEQEELAAKKALDQFVEGLSKSPALGTPTTKSFQELTGWTAENLWPTGWALMDGDFVHFRDCFLVSLNRLDSHWYAFHKDTLLPNLSFETAKACIQYLDNCKHEFACL